MTDARMIGARLVAETDRRLTRRGRQILAWGLALAIVAGSVILNPAAWREFEEFLGTSQAPTGWYNVLGGVPTALRLGIASVLGIAAIVGVAEVGNVRLVPIAVTLAYPVVWYHGLSTLVAIASPAVRRPPSLAPAQASGQASRQPSSLAR